MKLSDLLMPLGPQASPSKDADVTGVFNRSSEVIPGSLFVAINGTTTDGHDFLDEAVRRGAACLVVENPAKVPVNFTGHVARVQHTRSALDELCSRIHGYPSRHMFCVGVTGTDGKTTTTHMVEYMFQEADIGTGVIGNINHHYRDHFWPPIGTTPDPVQIQRRLADFRSLGAKAAAMEVSSHALSQLRVKSVAFDVAVFTNLTRDHLDYHGTVEEYFQAKQRLFSEILPETAKEPCFAIINVDTGYGNRLGVPEKAVKWTYGSAKSDFRYSIVAVELHRTVFRLNALGKEKTLSVPMPGTYNAANATAAIAVGIAAGLDLELCCQAIERFPGVIGRMQRMPSNSGRTVIVDYAHTPDAFDKVLSTIHAAQAKRGPAGKLWCVFGCGGDRDKGKRPLMLAQAMRHAETVVITSDNPRTENPSDIVDDIMGDISPEKTKGRIVVEPDRKTAIRYAIEHAQPNDVIMLLGKGHESYQIIGQETLPFSDYETARDILTEYEGGRGVQKAVNLTHAN